MPRMTRRLPVMTLVALLGASAADCSAGSDATDPSPPPGPAALVGTWTLRTVNDEPAPAVVAAGMSGPVSYLITVSRGHVTFNADNTFDLATDEIVTTDPGESTTITTAVDGDYIREGTVVTLVAKTCDPACTEGTTSVINLNTTGTELNYNGLAANPATGETLALELVYRKQ